MKCLRDFCDNLRWAEYGNGGSCMCQEHTEEVLRGERKAPPLRRNLDYQSTMRKTFLISDLNELKQVESSEAQQNDMGVMTTELEIKEPVQQKEISVTSPYRQVPFEDEYETATTYGDPGYNPIKPEGAGWRLISSVMKNPDRGYYATTYWYWERKRRP